MFLCKLQQPSLLFVLFSALVFYSFHLSTHFEFLLSISEIICLCFILRIYIFGLYVLRIRKFSLFFNGFDREVISTSEQRLFTQYKSESCQDVAQ